MILEKLPIKYNFSKRLSDIKYIVIHDTGNSAKSADAMSHFRYFNSANRKASANFFVDENGIVETVEVGLCAWHCGDGKGRYGITNSNSIGIEMCVNEGSDFEKTKLHTLNLIRFLMYHYNIPKDKVLRHFDASRKICPRSMSENNWEKWWEFKSLI